MSDPHVDHLWFRTILAEEGIRDDMIVHQHGFTEVELSFGQRSIWRASGATPAAAYDAVAQAVIKSALRKAVA